MSRKDIAPRRHFEQLIAFANRVAKNDLSFSDEKSVLSRNPLVFFFERFIELVNLQQDAFYF